MVISSSVKPLEWASLSSDMGYLQVLDQRALPEKLSFVEIHSVQALIEAIKTLMVRGAPAIGIAGAYGVVISAQTHGLESATASLDKIKEGIRQDARGIIAARPTAINLEWAVKQMIFELETIKAPEQLGPILLAKANALFQQDLQANMAMGQLGKPLVCKGANILTICNAGALATAGYGTALGVVRAAFKEDPTLHVFACETRPLLQGARLTAWELAEDKIPVTLLSDSMAGFLMQQGKVDLVIVGADRIAANGDTANKIGTYTLACLAQIHQIPFYVAAPLSTFDISLSTGADIPIEKREKKELQEFASVRITPQHEQIQYFNPAFDVTPHAFISAIITEHTVLKPDYTEAIKTLFKGL